MKGSRPEVCEEEEKLGRQATMQRPELPYYCVLNKVVQEVELVGSIFVGLSQRQEGLRWFRILREGYSGWCLYLEMECLGQSYPSLTIITI